MAGTNPNGANQYQLDPRQKLCWEFYANPTSETFNNGMASAIKAGYSESHANTITTEQWFQDKVRRLNLLSKAEKVLDEMMEMDVMEEVVYEGRETGIMKRNAALAKIKQDTSKFIAQTQGKHHGYTQRTEVDITTLGEKVGLGSLTDEEVLRMAEEFKHANDAEGVTGRDGQT